ncbi:hypothetical protein ACQPU1_09510 [Clostridium paraputrificum]|uniref:hypothetical protein n=1 Tax=Clostridium paraputrificum TaxID=29363 RepID=UPI003D3357DA
MDKFKYKAEVILPFCKRNLEKVANEYGEKGWEACGIDDGYILFKKKIEKKKE